MCLFYFTHTSQLYKMTAISTVLNIIQSPFIMIANSIYDFLAKENHSLLPPLCLPRDLISIFAVSYQKRACTLDK